MASTTHTNQHPGLTLALILTTMLTGIIILAYISSKIYVWNKEKQSRRNSDAESFSSLKHAWPPNRPIWPLGPGDLRDGAVNEFGMLDMTKSEKRNTVLGGWNEARTVVVWDAEPQDILKGFCASVHVAPEDAGTRFRVVDSVAGTGIHLVDEEDATAPQVPPKVLFTGLHREKSVKTEKSRQRSFTSFLDSDSTSSFSWSQHQSLDRSDSEIKTIKRARTIAKLEGTDPNLVDGGNARAHKIAAKSSAHRLSAVALNVQKRGKFLQRKAENADLRSDLAVSKEEKSAKRSSFLDAVLDAGNARQEFTFRC